MHKGSCLCKTVSFEVSAELKPADACHCTLCRKQTGHYFCSTNVQRSDLKIKGEDHVTWFHSSEKVRRGFCSKCGSVLFWDPTWLDLMAIAMGAFETPTGTHLEKHIFVVDKGDYYQITDGLPQKTGY